METMTAVPPRLRWALIGGFSILALLASTQQAHAQNDWPAVFIDKYSPGPTVSAAANNCSLCHTSVPARNPYGMTIEPANDTTIDAVSYTHLTLPTTDVVCRSRWSPYH